MQSDKGGEGSSGYHEQRLLLKQLLLQDLQLPLLLLQLVSDKLLRRSKVATKRMENEGKMQGRGRDGVGKGMKADNDFKATLLATTPRNLELSPQFLPAYAYEGGRSNTVTSVHHHYS